MRCYLHDLALGCQGVHMACHPVPLPQVALTRVARLGANIVTVIHQASNWLICVVHRRAAVCMRHVEDGPVNALEGPMPALSAS